MKLTAAVTPNQVLYHGSSCRITHFIFTGAGEPGFHFGSKEVAATFTCDRETGEQFPKAAITSVKLAVQNPYASPDVFPIYQTTGFANLRDNGIITQAEYEQVQNELFEEAYYIRRLGHYELAEEDARGRNKAAEAYKAFLVRAGFDGVVYANGKNFEGYGETCYIAFEKNQIQVMESICL